MERASPWKAGRNRPWEWSVASCIRIVLLSLAAEPPCLVQELVLALEEQPLCVLLLPLREQHLLRRRLLHERYRPVFEVEILYEASPSSAFELNSYPLGSSDAPPLPAALRSLHVSETALAERLKINSLTAASRPCPSTPSSLDEGEVRNPSGVSMAELAGRADSPKTYRIGHSSSARLSASFRL